LIKDPERERGYQVFFINEVMVMLGMSKLERLPPLEKSIFILKLRA